MGYCNTCEEDRPDVFRNDNFEDPCCDVREDSNCPVEESCACPLHLNGACVHYTGCKTFLSVINPGDTFDTVVMKIERIFEMINKEFTAMEEEIRNLKKEVKEIRDNYTGKEGCDEW